MLWSYTCMDDAVRITTAQQGLFGCGCLRCAAASGCLPRIKATRFMRASLYAVHRSHPTLSFLRSETPLQPAGIGLARSRDCFCGKGKSRNLLALEPYTPITLFELHRNQRIVHVNHVFSEGGCERKRTWSKRGDRRLLSQSIRAPPTHTRYFVPIRKLISTQELESHTLFYDLSYFWTTSCSFFSMKFDIHTPFTKPTQCSSINKKKLNSFNHRYMILELQFLFVELIQSELITSVNPSRQSASSFKTMYINHIIQINWYMRNHVWLRKKLNWYLEDKRKRSNQSEEIC
jgi:hypothetical protein